MKLLGWGIGVILVIGTFAHSAISQATIRNYTIQGSLKDNGAPANGGYDISYNLFDTETSTTIVGGNNLINVQVVNGVFTFEQPGYPELGFMTPGRTLWIEFGFRPAFSQQAFTILAPRQRINYVPFAVSSIDTMKLGGVAASQYVVTGDVRLTDARPPTPGSANYIQNQNASAQSASNFNVSGTGTAEVVSARSSFQLGSFTVLRTNGSESILIGDRAGANSTSSAIFNTMIGTRVGFDTTTGSSNSFFGRDAGRANQTGSGNSYFGNGAASNRLGNNNSVFGSGLGLGAPFRAGDFNSLFGHRAGENLSGSLNSFFGTGSGISNGLGSSNTFLGHNAGNANVDGSFNNALGEATSFGGPNLSNATVIGSKAQVSQSNSIVLGSINGVNGATADTRVGIGTTTPVEKLHINNGSIRVSGGGIYITNPNTLIITSPNGACWGITVNNSGAVSAFPITPCPAN